MTRTRRIIATSFLLGASLGAAELIFRIAFPLPEVTNFNRIDYSQTRYTPEMQTAQPLMNASFTWCSDPDEYSSVIYLNLYGFRDRQWKVNKTKPRVLMIGDSFVEGFMASQNETIAEGFRIRSKRIGLEVDMMNAGMGGTGIPHYLKLTRDIVPIFRPDKVVLILFANDLPAPKFDSELLSDPIDPEFRNPWMPRIAESVRRLWAGETIPFRWHKAPFPFLPAAPHPDNRWISHEDRDTLASIIDAEIIDAMLRGCFNTSWINEIEPYERKFSKPVEMKPHLSALRDYLDRFDTRLYVVYLPVRYQVTDYYLGFASPLTRETAETTRLDAPKYQAHLEELDRDCQNLSIPYLDLTPALREREDAGIRSYWNYDGHMNGETYLFVGEILADWVHPSGLESSTEIGHAVR